MKEKRKKLIIVGGGASGLFCAVNAARIGRNHLDIVVVERSTQLLAKVKVSGGGRCNVTNACFSIVEMVKKYPRGAMFLKKAFCHFFTNDVIDWFGQRGVALKTEADGRMFPVSDSSMTIVECLLKEAQLHGVHIVLNHQVSNIIRDNERWKLIFTNGVSMHTDYLCIASGGCRHSFQYEWLRQTGHTVKEPAPSLFTFNVQDTVLRELMGITLQDAQVKISGTKMAERGAVLITHWGFSGPAVLRLSAWAARELKKRAYQFCIHINWLPDYNEQTLEEKFNRLRTDLASQKIVNRNPFSLPQRFWEYLLVLSGINTGLRWADLPAKAKNKLIKNICSCEYQVNGKTIFKEEFVTAGGVDTSEVDHNTMQSKVQTGLFFVGEVLDVDGITGGYNFQNAWTTGYIAAKAIASGEY